MVIQWSNVQNPDVPQDASTEFQDLERVRCAQISQRKTKCILAPKERYAPPRQQSEERKAKPPPLNVPTGIRKCEDSVSIATKRCWYHWRSSIALTLFARNLANGSKCYSSRNGRRDCCYAPQTLRRNRRLHNGSCPSAKGRSRERNTRNQFALPYQDQLLR